MYVRRIFQCISGTADDCSRNRVNPFFYAVKSVFTRSPAGGCRRVVSGSPPVGCRRYIAISNPLNKTTSKVKAKILVGDLASCLSNRLDKKR